MSLIEGIQVFTSIVMFGVILIIQFVHYPSFLFVDQRKFVSFEHFHMRTISFIVIPTMILELGSSLILLYQGSSFFGDYIVTIFLLTLGTWASTFLLSIPDHENLRKKFCPFVVERLIYKNIPRTILWTIKVILIGKLFISPSTL